MTVLVSIPRVGKYPNRYERAGVLSGFGCILLLYFDALGRDIKLFHLLIWISIPLCYAMGNTFIARKLGGLDPMFAVMVSYFIPVVALAWWWMAGEKVTLVQVGVLCGILRMVGGSQRKPGRLN